MALLRLFDAKLYIFPLHRKLEYTSMEAVWSSANNSLETHLWVEDYQSESLQNRYYYVPDFTAVGYAQTAFLTPQ